MAPRKPKLGESLAEKRPDLLIEWDQKLNGDLTPWDVKPGSHLIVWWQCKEGHKYERMIAERCRSIGCSICSNNGTSYPEQYIYNSFKFMSQFDFVYPPNLVNIVAQSANIYLSSTLRGAFNLLVIDNN